MTFTLLKGSCPACKGAKRDCRQKVTQDNKTLIFCHDSSANPIDYILLGDDKWGFNIWGKAEEFKTATNVTDEQREQWRRERELERQQREREENERRARALPLIERDRQFRKLLDQLSLAPVDKADLQRRGLSDEEIKLGGFKSVEVWQRLDFEIDNQLPGVNLDGKSLNIKPGDEGYICPIRNVDGLIIGYQLRRRANDYGRYRWATSKTKKRPNGATSHLPNGELPIAVHRPAILKSRIIGLTEGTGNKPFIAAQRIGQVVLGAAGGNFAGSPEQFKEALNKLSIELDTKEAILHADGGAISNPHIMQQYRNTYQLAKQLGFEVSVGWWNQRNKSDPDVDELSIDTKIEIIAFSQLEEIAKTVPANNFCVSPEKQSYHCWDCQEGGNAIKFLMKINKQSFTDTVSKLANKHQITILQDTGNMNRIAQQTIELVKGKTDIVQTVSEHIELTKKGKDYVGNCPFHNKENSDSKTEELDPDTKLKLEIQLFIKEADPIRKLRLRSEICSYYRIPGKDLDNVARQIERSQSIKETKAYSFDELLRLETEALNWVIPEMLPVGETVILSAAPKAGKTLLATDVAFAVATGESTFLGEKTKQGKVLLIEADESLTSTRAKLLKRGFREGDNIVILPSWDITQLDKLETMLEDFRPDLVIVDSLRRIHHGSTISENSAEFADSIYTLKELFNRYKASGILIHHSNKDKESMGVNKLRGSSAIAGAVWGTWQLDHIPVQDPNTKKLVIDPKDPRRILSVYARDTEGQTLNIELDLENNSWIRQQAEEDTETKTLSQRILDLLGKNSRLPGLSGKEIIELLEEGKGVYTVLNRMANKLLISCHPAPGDRRVNLYSLPKVDVPVEFRDSPPPTPTVQNVDYYAENNTQQGLDNSQQISQHPPKISQHPETENTPVDFLNPDSERVSEIVNTPNEKGGGGGVDCASSDTLEEEKTVLKVGDSVILDCPMSPRNKEIVTILRPSKTEGYWVVQFSDGLDCTFPQDDLKLIHQMKLAL